MNTAVKAKQLPNRLADDFWFKMRESPYSYDIFQVLRRIDAQSGSEYLVGRAPHPDQEHLRLGQEPSMSFAPATLANIKQRQDSPLHEIAIFSFGLFGPNGPLPLHLTEYVRERVVHHQDRSMLDFCNLFHHRLIQLFYRAWANAQPTVSLDRPDIRNFDQYFSSLLGLSYTALDDVDSIQRHAKYFLAGHLMRRNRDAEGLEKILKQYFQVPVQIVQNIPMWLWIDPSEQACLKSGRAQSRLGTSMFLGVASREIQYCFRIEIGPLSRDDYIRFLPGHKYATQLRDWVRQYIGIELNWDVRLILKRDEVDSATLGGNQMLGLTSWFDMPDRPSDANDLIFKLEPFNSGFPRRMT